MRLEEGHLVHAACVSSDKSEQKSTVRGDVPRWGCEAKEQGNDRHEGLKVVLQVEVAPCRKARGGGIRRDVWQPTSSSKGVAWRGRGAGTIRGKSRVYDEESVSPEGSWTLRTKNYLKKFKGVASTSKFVF